MILYFFPFLFYIIVIYAEEGERIKGSTVLQDFYHTIANPLYQKCPDPRKLLPDCKECIPGLEGPTCDYSVDTVAVSTYCRTYCL